MMMLGGLYDEPAFARQPQPAYNRTQQLDRETREVEEEQQWKARDFWIAQDLVQVDKMDQERHEVVEQIADAQARLTLHIEGEPMCWARAPAVPLPPPPLAPVQEPASFLSYWPKSSEELRHLMQHDYEPVIDVFSCLSVPEEPAEVMDSPLTGEALLNRPVASNSGFSRPHLELVREEAARVTSFNHSLAALFNGYNSETEPDQKDEEPLISITEEEPMLFGESIWIVISVTEARSNGSSLSLSSIIIMPRGAQSVPTSSASASASNVCGEVDEDELSEHESDASSGSLISVLPSDDEE
ncbi:hypothetical protein K438DRAFT_1779371 [Mycena galopus ATCC 62051]|nr:hypothetical protein K438DRAFT_1779371 [Mycena galopus ATCC 62051]